MNMKPDLRTGARTAEQTERERERERATGEKDSSVEHACLAALQHSYAACHDPFSPHRRLCPNTEP